MLGLQPTHIMLRNQRLRHRSALACDLCSQSCEGAFTVFRGRGLDIRLEAMLTKTVGGATHPATSELQEHPHRGRCARRVVQYSAAFRIFSLCPTFPNWHHFLARRSLLYQRVLATFLYSYFFFSCKKLRLDLLPIYEMYPYFNGLNLSKSEDTKMRQKTHLPIERLHFPCGELQLLTSKSSPRNKRPLLFMGCVTASGSRDSSRRQSEGLPRWFREISCASKHNQ